MGNDKMSQKDFEAMLRNAGSTPWTRFRDAVILIVFKTAVSIGALWVIFHLDEIVAWWNGK